MRWRWFFAVTGAGGLTLISRSVGAQQLTYTDVLDSGALANQPQSVELDSVNQIVVGANGQVAAVVTTEGYSEGAIYYASSPTTDLQDIVDTNNSGTDTSWGTNDASTFTNLGGLAVSNTSGGALLSFQADTSANKTGVFQINPGDSLKTLALYTGQNYPATNGNATAAFDSVAESGGLDALAANSSGSALFYVQQKITGNGSTNYTVALSTGASATPVTPPGYPNASPQTPIFLTDSGLAVYQNPSGNSTTIDQTIGNTTTTIPGNMTSLPGATPLQLLAAATVTGNTTSDETLFAANASGNTSIYLQQHINGNVTLLASAPNANDATLLGAMSGNGDLAFNLPDGTGNITKIGYVAGGSVATKFLATGATLTDPNAPAGNQTQTLESIEDEAGPLLVNNSGIVIFNGQVENDGNVTEALLEWNPQAETLTAIAEVGDDLTFNLDGNQTTGTIKSLGFNYMLSDLATGSNGNLGADDTIAFGIAYVLPADESTQYTAVLTASLVPEPTFGGMLVLGAAPLAFRRRRRSTQD
jgi:hypothetical protein